ncbi:MAG: glycosyltransferase [Candidatus Synoicihabitans palmerolidicus]|nr:glycosyltransferase [Candidatus Synoicihabitans palmerolidicus]
MGIVAPRKNQQFLITVADRLWEEGLPFELHIVGRVNPHFGEPVAKDIKAMTTRRPGLRFHEGASDGTFAELLARARAVVFLTIAEGCGLPVLESLWRGLPSVCSDLPVLRENTHEGGWVLLPTNDLTGWSDGLKRVLFDDERWRGLADVAAQRNLPTWAERAREVRRELG